jgi:hypothetical protein
MREKKEMSFPIIKRDFSIPESCACIQKQIQLVLASKSTPFLPLCIDHASRSLIVRNIPTEND